MSTRLPKPFLARDAPARCGPLSSYNRRERFAAFDLRGEGPRPRPAFAEAGRRAPYLHLNRSCAQRRAVRHSLNRGEKPCAFHPSAPARKRGGSILIWPADRWKTGIGTARIRFGGRSASPSGERSSPCALGGCGRFGFAGHLNAVAVSLEAAAPLSAAGHSSVVAGRLVAAGGRAAAARLNAAVGVNAAVAHFAAAIAIGRVATAAVVTTDVAAIQPKRSSSNGPKAAD